MIRTADVVVVGAGVLGASAAHRLAAAGLRVIILDRETPNREGSGTTAGNLHIQGIHTRRPGQEVPVDSARFLPLQRAASDLWDEVEEELGTCVEVQRTGGFMVAETPDEVAQLHEKSVWEREVGLPTEVLDGDAARDAMPQLGPTVASATWCALDGYANPLLVGPAYLRAAQRLGAELIAGHPVAAISRTMHGWRVIAGDETVDCSWLINTTGPWIQPITRLAGVELRMTPVSIQMHVTVRTGPTLPHLVQHIGQGLSVKQVVAGNILIGGGWPAARMDLNGRSIAGVESMVGNIRQAARILPVVGRLNLLRMWAGPLAATPDEMPVIGAVPGLPRFLVAGGTYAFTFAPLWAQVLTSMVLGEPSPVDVDDLGPGRLVTGHLDAIAP